MAYQKVSPCHHNESGYKTSCPFCSAPPGFRCVSRRTGQAKCRAHRQRFDRKRLPDLSAWWRAMGQYEGEHAKPRPADLVVP
jgi:hypothetical protein